MPFKHPHLSSMFQRLARRRTCLALAVCFFTAVSFAARATQSDTPASAPVNEHRVGKFMPGELVTPDLAASKRFYGALFGWSFRDRRFGATPYAEAEIDGVMVAGLSQRPLRSGERQPAWLSIMAVADVDAARKIALAQGARALAGPLDLPAQGRLAVLADPQGAVFGLLASERGPAPDTLPEPGEWIWHTLFTSDHDRAVAFYQNLFDFEVFPAPQADTIDGRPMQTILASGGYARASASGIPASWARVHPHWLGYIRVADAAASAARAVALGGRLLVPAHPDRHGGRLAVVADPQRAPIGLLEWSVTQASRGTP